MDILFHKEPLNKKKLSVNDDKDLHRFITDGTFLRTFDFIWKVVAITSVSCIPLYILKYLRKKFSPPVYAKLTWWTSQFSFFLTDSLSYRMCTVHYKEITKQKIVLASMWNTCVLYVYSELTGFLISDVKKWSQGVSKHVPTLPCRLLNSSSF